MHVVLWRFRVLPGREDEFEAAYGKGGDWDRFFRESEGYEGSHLMRASDGAYLTIDRWASEDAYRAFRERHASRYAELDAACELLTREETFLGAVEA